MKRAIRYASMAAALLFGAAAADGQQITSSVVGSGWTAATNGTVIVAGTLGQTIIGPVGSNPIVGQGFWYTLPVGTSGIRERYEAGNSDAVVLRQNTPNPFSTHTVIGVELPDRREISLKLYDGLGRQRAVLAEGVRDAGRVVIELTSDELESGRYTVQLVSGSIRRSIAITVVK